MKKLIFTKGFDTEIAIKMNFTKIIICSNEKNTITFLVFIFKARKYYSHKAHKSNEHTM